MAFALPHMSPVLSLFLSLSLPFPYHLPVCQASILCPYVCVCVCAHAHARARTRVRTCAHMSMCLFHEPSPSKTLTQCVVFW
jgi:hypothetical protein